MSLRDIRDKAPGTPIEEKHGWAIRFVTEHGSELVFHCTTREEADDWFRNISGASTPPMTPNKEEAEPAFIMCEACGSLAYGPGMNECDCTKMGVETQRLVGLYKGPLTSDTRKEEAAEPVAWTDAFELADLEHYFGVTA